MRKIIAITILFLLAAFSVSAQDLLVRRDGTQTRVKVLEVTKKKVKYVRFMTESPVYTLPVGDIDYIEYPNGDRDTFKPKAAKPTTPAESDAPKKWRGPMRNNQPPNLSPTTRSIRRFPSMMRVTSIPATALRA